MGYLRDQLSGHYQGKYSQVTYNENEFWEVEADGVRVSRLVHDPSHERYRLLDEKVVDKVLITLSKKLQNAMVASIEEPNDLK